MRGGTHWFHCLLSPLVVTGLVCLAGCGSDNSTDPIDESVEISLTPAQVMVRVQHTYQFNAVVTNATNTNVTWTLDEGADWGSVDSNGLYSAPDSVPDPAIATVRVTSVADTTKQATAQVDIAGLITVTMSPEQVTALLGTTQQFNAVVTNTANTDVIWTLDEGADWGSVDSNGFYTAPGSVPDPAIATVRVTSVADTTKQAIAQVDIASLITVTILPEQVTAFLGTTHQFNALATNATNADVTWSLDEGADWGSVDSTGFFTAPDSVPDPAIATVRVTSIEDATKQATAQIDIVGLITVTISPEQVTVQLGTTHQFGAVVTSTTDLSVIWSIDEGADWGNIDSDGLYTAPAVLPPTYSLTVRATSTFDPEVEDTARLFLSNVDPATMVPDFMLEDMHPYTETSGTLVSPRDYQGKVSVWAFIRGSP